MKASSPLCLFVLLCACILNLAFTQNPILTAPGDAASARQLLAEAIAFCDSNQFVPCSGRAELAYNFFRLTPDSQPSDLAEAAYQSGRALFKQDSFLQARAFLEKATETWASIHPDGSVEESKVRLELGSTLRQLEDAAGSMEQGQKTIAMLDHLKIENGPLRFGALRLIGRTLYGTGQYNKAIPYYEEALKHALVFFGEETAEMARMMIYLGNCYNYGGLQERAIATLERALAIQQKKLPPFHDDIAGTSMALGSCSQALKKYDNAMAYYEKAIEIRSRSEEGKNVRLPYAYSKIGQICLESQDFEKALEFFQKSNEIFIYHKSEADQAYAYTCRDFGLAYHGLRSYEEAIKWYEKALVIFQGAKTAGNLGMGLDQSSLVFQIGRTQSASGAYEEALQSFMETQKMLSRLFGAEYPFLYESNAEIAHVYAQLYIKTNQDSFLAQSRAYFSLARKGVEQQLQNEIYNGSEKIVLADALSYFDRAISAELLYLKKHPDDPEALENAWQISESMHSYLLLSSTQEANARQFAGIPAEDLHRDSLLRAKTTYLKKRRQSLIEQGHGLTDSLVLNTNAQIFATKEDHAQLRAFFENNHPDYFRLKYELKNSSLENTQQQLSSHQTLLEYFTGDSSIFVFIVQQKGSRVVEIPRDFPLNKWVHDFHEGISGYHAAAAAQKTGAHYQKTVRQYADAAQNLYEKLLAPLTGSLTTEIIIVPGDGLTNLPFEALLSATPKNLSNFKTYPFLLRTHTVQYAYSATMLHQMTARRHPQPNTDGLLAFAPFFEEDTTSLALRLERDGAIRLGLSALPFSGEEVIQAKKRYGGKSAVLTGKTATKEKFLDLAAKYKVLHLATHGKANHLEGEFSFLAFAPIDGNQENGLLSVGELYNLPLNADLVLLSACETGIGEQQRGEGVVSLARAFAFAGAKGIVASLWSVNDKSTMQVMDNFYAELKSGKTKNIALANAKRQYLEKNPGQMHPFYWAAFVAVGDMAAIKN